MNRGFCLVAVVLWVGMVLAGCSSDPVRACSTDADCGEGGVCVEQRCRANADGTDASVPADGGGDDAGFLDGGADAGDAGEVEDGGGEDGGVEDGGMEDGGFEDGGVEDGGVEDGGVDAGLTCAPACASWQECVGTTCQARYAGIAWRSPAAGTRLGSVAVPVEVELESAAGATERNDPATLNLSAVRHGGGAATATLTLTGVAPGVYAGTINLAQEGTWFLTASWGAAGLDSPVRGVEVDVTPPAFVVTDPGAVRAGPDGGLVSADPEPGFATAWRRDERARVLVQSNATDVVPGSVYLVIRGTDGTTPGPAMPPVAVQRTTGCGTNYCGEVEVPMWEPELRAFRGTFEVEVTGEDTAGNVGNGSGAVKVTRWKWMFDTGSSGVLTSPALSEDGKVYVGSDPIGSPGALYVFNPDGSRAYANTALGQVTASPVVSQPASGAPTAYFPVSNASGSRIYAYSAGSAMPLTTCNFTTAQRFLGALALGQTAIGPSAYDSLYGIANLTSSSGTLIGLIPATSLPCPQVPAGAAAGPRQSVIIDGNSLFLSLQDQADVRAFDRQAFTPAAGWPVQVGFTARGLAASSGQVVGGGGFAAAGGVFSIPMTGGVVSWQFPATGTSSPAANGPAIAANGELVYGSADGNLRRIAVGTTSPAHVSAASGEVVGVPAIGADELLYTASNAGSVEAWTSDLQRLWSFPAGGSFESSVTLDCARDAAGTKTPGRPGVLYATSNDGKVYSLVTDSRGLDTTAPWPKFQRDPRNTGNTATSLLPFACP